MLNPTNLLNRVHEECCRKCLYVYNGVPLSIKNNLGLVFPRPITFGMRFDRIKRSIELHYKSYGIKDQCYENAFDLIGDMGSFELVKYFQIMSRGDEHGYDYVYTKELQAELANFGVWYDSDETYTSIISANTTCAKNNIIMIVD